jgi:aminomethyltransferase
MPVQYRGIVAEHRAVRTSWGIFDVSHMGRINVSGADAVAFLDWIATADIAGLLDGRARYGVVCQEDGGILDDVVVLRKPDGEMLMVCNASNRSTILEWLQSRRFGFDVDIDDDTEKTAMIAVQGKESAAQLDVLLNGPVSPLRRFGAAELLWQGERGLASRTGYCGEDGFELVVQAHVAPKLWAVLLDAGATPCGLGARDSLRLEAGLLLYGNDIDATTTPLEAGLERFVAWDGAEFVGKDALLEARRRGPARKLVAFSALARGPIPRHGHLIFHEGRQVGSVTSGGFSPTVATAIGLGYVGAEDSATGAHLEVEVRGVRVAVEVVDLPFYKKKPLQGGPKEAR